MNRTLTSIAAICIAGTAQAASLPDDSFTAPTIIDGSVDPFLAGTVINDNLIPVTIGSLTLSIQNRVVLSDQTGTLIFAPRIRDIVSPTADYNIEGLFLSSFAGFETSVFLDTSSQGEISAIEFERSEDDFSIANDGTTIGVVFPDFRSAGGTATSSTFSEILTDAKAFDLNGTFQVFGTLNGDFFAVNGTGLAQPAVIPLPAAGALGVLGFAALAGLRAARRRA